jgi:hypothetical protein
MTDLNCTDMNNTVNLNMGRPATSTTIGTTTIIGTTPTIKTQVDEISAHTVVDERPFKKAITSYQAILDRAILEAINQLTQNTNKYRYARVKLGLFTEVIEIENKNSTENKTYTYPLHKLHYGPINKVYTDSMMFPTDASPDYVKASKFCYRDWMIWTKVNAEGKNLGGNGFGYGGTACSPFRDVQISLRDKGYYLQDLSQYVFDKHKNKWYYNIDIRLYQDRSAVQPKSLWHQYGMIPGLVNIDNENNVNVGYNGYSRRNGYNGYNENNQRYYQNKRNVNYNNYDHGDMNLNKVVPTAKTQTSNEPAPNTEPGTEPGTEPNTEPGTEFDSIV